jgi:hypothetical protein
MYRYLTTEVGWLSHRHSPGPPGPPYGGALEVMACSVIPGDHEAVKGEH